MPDLRTRVAETRSKLNGRAEARAIAGVPWRPWDNPYQKFDTGGPLKPSRTAHGIDSALRLAALYGCARLLCDGIASLPLRQYVLGSDGEPLRWAGPSWLDKPSAVGSLFDWLWQGTASAVLQGNALGLITGRDGFGYPTGAEWLPFEYCAIVDPVDQMYNPLRAQFFFMGRELPRDDLIHLRAFTVPGRTEGISPLRAFANLISSGTAAIDYGARWFEKGGFPPGVFQNTELEVAADEAREIRRTLTRTIQAGEPLVYGRDWEYKPVSVPPSEAQFIQAVQLNATQIAAIYGIPPERVGGTRGSSLTYSTQEQETISLITDTLRPWLVRWEAVLNPLTPSRRYIKFDADDMIRTDIKTRHEVYKLRRDMGMATVNELRRAEDQGPLGDTGDGDEPLPLEVLVAMARGMKAVPKSMEHLVDLSTVAPGVEGNAPAGGDTGGAPTPDETGASDNTGQASDTGRLALAEQRLRLIRARYPELRPASNGHRK